jgi:hypothetical protein
LSQSDVDSSLNPIATGGLTELFRLQDEALTRHLLDGEILGRTAALSSLIGICYETLNQMEFSRAKQIVIRRFTLESLSHVVVGARIGLWGALPESHSVLRGAIESCAQLALVVTQSGYEGVLAEARRDRFQEYSFRQACKKLGQRGRRLMDVHNRFSALFAHSTPRRFKNLDYEFEGQQYARLAHAVDPNIARLCVHFSLTIAAELTRCLMEAHLQDGKGFPGGDDFELLVDFAASLPGPNSSAAKSPGCSTVPGGKT